MIKRYYNNLEKLIMPKKALVIYGPRRVGKTTLLENFLKNTKLKYKLDSGDNIITQEILNSQDFSKILEYVESYELLAIDEAQQIKGIGMALKILVDQRPDIKVVVTGSSSFDLENQVGEPLTGRKRSLVLYPFSQLELLDLYNKAELKENLEDFLIFGTYPEVITSRTKQEKTRILSELVASYLLKDILTFERVKGSQVLLNLLKLLSFQLGSEVSLNELATQLKIDVKTVDRYLELLEKSFVIHRLTGFSRNLRKEVVSKNKYYFYDNGIRNAIISQFNPPTIRNDMGQLWENFIVSERLKKRSYKEIYGASYFWRTYDQKEIDLIEEREGNLFAYEIKFSDYKSIKPPQEWVTEYPKAEFKLITSQNYLDFIL